MVALIASHGMFSFPWPSTAGNERTLPHKAHFMRTATPGAQIPVVNKMKRKREDSSPSIHPAFPPSKRTEIMSHVQMAPPDAPQEALPVQATEPDGGSGSNYCKETKLQELTGDPATALSDTQGPNRSNGDKPVHDHNDAESQYRSRHSSKGSVSRSALCDAIEAQFGLEILLKHKELRLIDQEFAKCQVALEQLRRCQVVPYPAMSSNPETMQAAVSGSGTTFNNRAPYAPSWGVADGPYSRHYQRWLIPDSAFDDSIGENGRMPAPAGKRMPERATRGTKSEIGTAVGNSRSQRGSHGARLKALPHGYPEPKEEKGPMIVKRGSDGKMVKLVCLDCRRSNFNSAQGFINHCRIAHSRQFLSHDAAIEASGEEIDGDAEGGVGETNNASQATASSALVHPLIRSSAHLARTAATEPSTISSMKRRRSQATSSAEKPSTTVNTSPTMSTPQQTKLTSLADPTPFTPSPQAPHLSAFFAKLGRGGDLEDMVSEATARPEVDLSLSSDDEDDESMEVAAGTSNASQSRSTRGVMRGGHLPARQTKSPATSEQSPAHHSFCNGPQKPPCLSNINLDQAYLPPYPPDDTQEEHSIAINNDSTPFNLSPNTIEAHTAPSLVSDDGDYENTHSESESHSSAEADDDEDHYIHAELIDHDDMHLGESTSAAHHIGLGGKPHASAVRRRPSAMPPPIALHNGEAEQRHVSFASPARRQRRDSRTAGGK